MMGVRLLAPFEKMVSKEPALEMLGRRKLNEVNFRNKLVIMDENWVLLHD